MCKFFKFSAFIFIFTFSVFTANASSVILSPPKFEFDADPGQEISDSITISNKGKTPLRLSASLQDFISSGESGQPAFVNPENNDISISLAKWITVNEENDQEIIVPAGKKVSIDFTIKVPEDAEPGGKYGAVFFAPPKKQGQVTIVQKVGSLVLVRVSGEIREEGNLSKFGIFAEDIKGEDILNESSNFFFEKPPVDFAIRFKNTGNVHIKPQGKIEVFNFFGKQLNPVGVKNLINEKGLIEGKQIVDFIPVNEEKGNILAGTFRTYRAKWSGAPYWYKEEDGTKVIKNKGFPIGIYSAKLTLTGPEGEEITDAVRFFVFPWKIIFGSLIVLALLVFGFIKYRKWSYKRMERRIKQQLQAMEKAKNE